MSDRIVRALLNNAAVVYAVNSTQTASDAQRIHQLGQVATAALGRTLTMGAIMGTLLKNDEDSVTLNVAGDGPLGAVVVVGKPTGDVKGYVAHPQIELPLRADGKLNVGAAVGKGRLGVVKSGIKQPYVGQVDLQNGEIAQDFAWYFSTSEQTPTAVALGVALGPPYGAVVSSGGLMVQTLPFCDEETLQTIERDMAVMPQISTLVRDMEMEEILTFVFPTAQIDILDTTPIRYQCDCSRERMERALISLGEAELTQLMQEDGKADLTCHFCQTQHTFSIEDLQRILLEAK